MTVSCGVSFLNFGGHWRFVVVASVDAFALCVNLYAGLAVKFGQSVKVELRLLDYLDLANMAILDGVDWLSCLDDIGGDTVWQKLFDELWDVAVADLSRDDFGHLFADLLDLLRLSVGGLFDLLLSLLLGESDDEHSDVVVVGGFGVDVALDHGLPFLDHRAHLVARERHTVEVEDAVLALHVLAHELELAESGAVLVQVGLVAVEDSALETVGGDLVTDGSGDKSLSDLSDLEHSWRLDVIPVLLGEWVDDLLLTSLFGSLRETFILANGHGSVLFFWFFFCKFDLRL